MEEKVDRRKFLENSLGVLTGVVALMTLGGIVSVFGSVVYPPKRNIEGKIKLGWLKVGNLKELQEEIPKLVEYGEDKVFLVKIKNGEVLALNAACTHLGCLLVWNEKEKKYKCPCHAGAFAVDGKRLYGPPPRDMDKFNVKLVGGSILIKGAESAS
jgi:cytochrome b6-f complex iron-sulfur subunit